jgi:tellurite resistance protein TehA-like permease
VITAGIVIVALPDSGERLFSISRDHGPSMQDAIGLILIFIGYAWFLRQTWRRREKLFQYKNRVSFKLILPMIVVAIVVVIISIINDYGYWWVCGAIILAILQSIIFYIALAD